MELNGKDYTKYETGCAEVDRSTVVFKYFLTHLLSRLSLSLPLIVSLFLSHSLTIYICEN